MPLPPFFSPSPSSFLPTKMPQVQIHWPACGLQPGSTKLESGLWLRWLRYCSNLVDPGCMPWAGQWSRTCGIFVGGRETPPVNEADHCLPPKRGGFRKKIVLSQKKSWVFTRHVSTVQCLYNLTQWKSPLLTTLQTEQVVREQEMQSVESSKLVSWLLKGRERRLNHI